MNPSMLMTVNGLAQQLEYLRMTQDPRIMHGFNYQSNELTLVTAIKSVMYILKGVTGEIPTEEWQSFIAKNYLPGYIPDHLLEQTHPSLVKLSCKLEEVILDPIWLQCVNLAKGSSRITVNRERKSSAWVDATVGLPEKDSLTDSAWTYVRVSSDEPVMDDSALEDGKRTVSELVVLLEARAAKEAKLKHDKIMGLLKHGLDPSIVYDTPTVSLDRVSFFNSKPSKSTRPLVKERELRRLAVNIRGSLVLGPYLPNQGVPTDNGEIKRFMNEFPMYCIITSVGTVNTIQE